jgi:23S rRNA (adenine2503-C2)-methyltransferase
LSNLLELSDDALKELLLQKGQKPYRADQIRQWIWEKGALSLWDMTNLPKSLREQLAGQIDVVDSRLVEVHRTPDGTLKCLLELCDAQQVETVLIPSGRRATACVSTQVGCAMGCLFCASGLEGVERNLTGSEILQQILWLRHQAARPVTNVVFMGMGEPLANLDATVEAIESIVDPDRLGISARKVTVSTVGLVSGIRRLARLDLPVTLALSLHAPNDALRRRLIPSSAGVTIAELMEAAREFYRSRNREVTLEYVLLKGINDSRRCAEELASWASGLRCNVNLIRYNPVASLDYESPTPAKTQEFAQKLQRLGVNVQVRKSRGVQADAACGQLRKGHHRDTGSRLGKADHRKEP